ncbi:phage tail protein [Vreelandella titanicae]|jgi:microcystin-dependent protein|uniref:Phage tail collar n=1 Tax=Vreelandella titanicae BH1 TaxID=1204738 RepID=L9U5Y8_9GAMM|nr:MULTISPECIES: tail fiber protein [Halomonas]ELY20289.1 Phage tail collar [Halomonas titanicae BH1]MCD1586430.1 tail fiber protein [Halomonas sp. IOP_14]NVE93205.1 phage tail protein [Halomonas titanicae]
MDPFLGEIKMFGFEWAPRGWGVCNGAQLSIAQNTALFSLLGVVYGGNGQTTFNLPDLRGRMPRGQGQGAGMANVDIGELAGAENRTLTINEMPQHTHAAGAMTTPDDANQATPATGDYLASGKVGLSDSVRNYYSGTPSGTVELGNGQTGISGGSQPFNVMNPYLALNFSIALQGIYPSRQ